MSQVYTRIMNAGLRNWLLTSQPVSTFTTELVRITRMRISNAK
jgi:hypothetical protein